MKTHRFWPAVWIGFGILGIGGSAAGSGPTSITACGTTIGAPGSYVVTANLIAARTTVPCIKVTAAAVTINLGGFVLSGIGGSPGIMASAGPLIISNGFIKLFSVGINAPVIGARLSDVEVSSSQGAGAVLGDDAQVTDSNFVSNGGDGLDVGSNARIARCGFFTNKGNGIQAKGASTVITSSRASGNNANGFLTTHGGSVLRNNTANANSGNGFLDQLGGSALANNTASSNGKIGIEAFSSTLIGNTASGNKDFGFADDGSSTYDGDASSNNTFDGFVSTSGNPSTFVDSIASNNGRDGFNAFCPNNFINITALFNKTKNFNLTGSGCRLTSVLAP
jgi:parallel beta-helix repeat protein